MSKWKTAMKADREGDEQEPTSSIVKIIAWGIVAFLFILVVVPLVTLLAKGWVNLMRWIVAL